MWKSTRNPNLLEFEKLSYHLPEFQIIHTPCGNGKQDGFWIPVKIPAKYVSLMPKLPGNAKMKMIYGGTYFSIGFSLGDFLLSWIPLP